MQARASLVIYMTVNSIDCRWSASSRIMALSLVTHWRSFLVRQRQKRLLLATGFC